MCRRLVPYTFYNAQSVEHWRWLCSPAYSLLRHVYHCALCWRRALQSISRGWLCSSAYSSIVCYATSTAVYCVCRRPALQSKSAKHTRWLCSPAFSLPKGQRPLRNSKNGRPSLPTPARSTRPTACCWRALLFRRPGE